jgi:PQQ-dependent dehydrogenase (s-GDH family)
MKRIYCLATIIALIFSATAFSQNESFSKRVINSSYNLNSAWEITYGPKDSLWVTENRTYLVSRINIATGSKTVLLDLLGTSGDAEINFAQTATKGSKKKNSTSVQRVVPAVWPQGGLMGMALHPALYSTDVAVRSANPWVYIAYVYNYANPATCSSSRPCFFYTKIVRYKYSGNSLTSPVLILDSIPGSNDHNSGRLKIGPDLKLYYTVGDMGAGQFNNTSRTNNAQVIDVMEGKVLRLNTVPDNETGKDMWIPNDNPFYDAAPFTPKDYVYSFGHRNAQGLDWVNINGNNLLFSSEHGDKSDDEVNIIKAGNSYGWNRVSGYCDGNYDGLTLGGYTPVDEGAYCTATPNNVQPIFTTFTATPAEISRFTGDMFTFKTIAPSSIEVYKDDIIPGWKNSVLVSSLKGGRVYRMKLDDATGSFIVPLSSGVDTAAYFAGQGRFRDIAISPDGKKIYVACDLSGATSGPTGGFNNKINTTTPPNAGKILEFTYTGASGARLRTDVIAEQFNFTLYPNPANNSVVIQANNFNKPMIGEVYDILGAKVKSVKASANSFVINLNGLSKGVYSVRVSDMSGKVWMIQKLIKQ